MISILPWVAFLIIVITLLAIDLRVTGSQDHALTSGEALSWSAFYILLAMLFNVAVYFLYEHQLFGIGTGEAALSGQSAAVEFFTAWLIEKSLSLDNIFVIALIFTHFGIGRREQHRVLFWGILGALVMRGMLIFAGSELLRRFTWTTFVFGGILILTAVRMLVVRHDTMEPGRTWIVRLASRFLPVTDGLRGHHFIVTENGRRYMTPLFLALLVVESFDLLFAVDSVPAALAVTDDPFLVFTSNIFAILGLRALYFVLASYLESLRYLKVSLVFLLIYVGVKLMLSHSYPIPIALSLAIIGATLGVGVIASLIAQESDPVPLRSPLSDELAHVTMSHARKVSAMVIGSTGLGFGIAALVAPGSGFPLAIAGLIVVGMEVEWARRWLLSTKRRTRPIAD